MIQGNCFIGKNCTSSLHKHNHTNHTPPLCPAPSCCVCQVIAHELEFISKQAKGQQAKGRARQRRYDELVESANAYVKNTQVRHQTISVWHCRSCMARWPWSNMVRHAGSYLCVHLYSRVLPLALFVCVCLWTSHGCPAASDTAPSQLCTPASCCQYPLAPLPCPVCHCTLPPPPRPARLTASPSLLVPGWVARWLR
jgi:hypothetical protein